jgi:DNA-binding NarL/FixJ family response regulator
MDSSLHFSTSLPSGGPLDDPPRSSGDAADPVDVFVVDDHPAIREVLSSMIGEEAGMRAIGSRSNAEEALPRIQTLDPDVAIVDISLDGVDGLTLTRRISAKCPDTSVLIFSMYAEHVYAERAIRAGASGYLPKTVQTEAVIEAIREIDDGKVHLPQDVLANILNHLIRDEPDREHRTGIRSLTEREMTVFQMLGNGDSVSQIADSLGLNRKTIETYRRRAKEKLGCDTVDELLRYAVLRTRGHSSEAA